MVCVWLISPKLGVFKSLCFELGKNKFMEKEGQEGREPRKEPLLIRLLEGFLRPHQRLKVLIRPLAKAKTRLGGGSWKRPF